MSLPIKNIWPQRWWIRQYLTEVKSMLFDFKERVIGYQSAIHHNEFVSDAIFCSNGLGCVRDNSVSLAMYRNSENDTSQQEGLFAMVRPNHEKCSRQVRCRIQQWSMKPFNLLIENVSV